MLTPMNYRRGLQRIYAVLTVAWIAGALFVLPAERLNFRSIEQPPEVAAFIRDFGEASLWKAPLGYERYKPINLPDVLPAEFFQRRDAAVAAQERAEQSGPRFRAAKALWLFGVLLLPPLLGYALLFGVIPWIYRGFRH
jgi:hypothetical protein